MIGLDLRAQPSAQWWPDGAVYAADFTMDRYMIDGVAVPREAAFSFTRNSPKLAQDSQGNWHQFGVDEPAITDRGLLLEPAATNMVPNSAMTGAALGIVGAGGALPTGWISSAFETITVQAIGTEGGLPFIELRLQTSNGTASTRYAYLRAAQEIPAQAGQTWTASAFYRKVAGAWHPDSNSFLNVQEAGSTTTYRTTPRIGEMNTRTRLSRTWTADRTGTVQLTLTVLQFNVLPTDSVDVTLRIYAPQLAMEAAPSGPIITQNLVSTRVDDNPVFRSPPGSHQALLTFEDGAVIEISANGDLNINIVTAQILLRLSCHQQ